MSVADRAPDYIRELLRHLPSVWEDVKFVAGYPGKFVVLARRGEGCWYVAGINGEADPRSLTLDFSELGVRTSGTLITDGDADNLSFRRETIDLPADSKLPLTLAPRGGFLAVFE